MFNWLAVIVLLPLEAKTGLMEWASGGLADMAITNNNETSGAANVSSLSLPNPVKAVTGPLVDRIVRIDKKVAEGWTEGLPEYDNVTTMLAKVGGGNGTAGGPAYLLHYLGADGGVGLPDAAVGTILAVASVAAMMAGLVSLVKLLGSLMGPRVAALVSARVNSDPVPGAPWLTGYLALLIGAVATFFLQSSSAFTSTLTPMAGAGLVGLERAYPLTLGSNLGTTATSLMASLSAEGAGRRPALQIAFVHMLFNLAGILMFYVVPCCRFPIGLARRLGDLTARYPWVGLAYLALAFFLLPGALFGLGRLGAPALYSVLGIAAATLAFVLFVNALRAHRPSALPPVLRSWEFLPAPLRSLEPYDAAIGRLRSCCGCPRENLVDAGAGAQAVELEAVLLETAVLQEVVASSGKTNEAETPFLSSVVVEASAPRQQQQQQQHAR